MTTVRETMRRRTLLATAGSVGLAGCTTSLPTLCSRPAFRADRLEFETIDFSSLSGWWLRPDGAVLVAAPDHVERLEPPEAVATALDLEVAEEERAFVDGTDLSASMLVGVIVTSAAGSTDARVTHVVRDGRTVHCYVCIRRRGMDDVGAHQARLIRVADRWATDDVRVTFTNGGDGTETFDSDGTGAAVRDRWADELS
ncbi:hypothetical protein AArcMg_0342 [Natrarchaeobaculum sulfurireducens]|uniref:Lipoprotein n=2 Tax=Natrarchaeobaculum sulfurireducens TaxID=2044521 RepID=A0A346PLH0_9EURY|nr:hypothetical protein AArcMg_0342 [Natrarchaeobaculum sulfurireducens]